MSAFCGTTYWLWWQDCDLDGWSLRTRQGLLPGFPPSSVALPASGTWDLTGYWPQAPLGPPIDETVSSLLLPTPVAQDSSTSTEAFLERKSRDGSQRTTVTSLQVLMTGCLLPTPTAGDAKSSTGQKDQPDRPKAGTTLTEAARAMALLPTPMARDGDGRTGGANNARRRVERGHGPMLPEMLDWIGSSGCQTAPPETTGRPSGDMRLF